MRIVIDLDGTISELKKEGGSYADVMPKKGAVEKIKDLKSKGHYIIIHSARHMKTCNGDVSLVEKRVGDITREWLKKHDIPYDELIFGRPNAEIYICDRSIRFEDWEKIDENFLKKMAKEK